MSTASLPISAAPVTLDTASEHLSREVPVAGASETAEQLRALLCSRRFESVADIAVCEAGRLVGLIPVEALLAAPGVVLARELMDSDPPVVRPGLDQERVAWKAVQHGESSLAVVDESGKFVGLIPPQRMLAVLLEEHHEDMARLSGLMRGALVAREPLQEPVWQRFWHRVPWLLMGLAGAMVAADLVAEFETSLRNKVALAFFLPGIVYLADAVGTQTETLVVRGLSVGLPMSRVVLKELATGLLIGLSLALVSIPVALWRWQDAAIVKVLALALVFACSIATVVAVALPWLLTRFRSDPAFGSGPLATVIQDLLSILIYFLIAGWVLG